MLLPNLKKLVLGGYHSCHLWPSDEFKFLMAMQDPSEAIFHLKRFLRTRKDHTGCIEKLSIEVCFRKDTPEVPLVIQETLAAYAEFSKYRRGCQLDFLLNPRSQWDCVLDFDEVEDVVFG